MYNTASTDESWVRSLGSSREEKKTGVAAADHVVGRSQHSDPETDGFDGRWSE
jgi:hypothetical protein